VFHLAAEGAFSEGLVQAARVPDDGSGFIVVLDDDLRTRQMRDCQAAPVARPSWPVTRLRSMLENCNEMGV
jgi:hypothetical protein